MGITETHEAVLYVQVQSCTMFMSKFHIYICVSVRYYIRPWHVIHPWPSPVKGK
jgi:hypothetical protein